MDKDLLQPTATILASLIAKDEIGAVQADITSSFIRVYRQIEAAKKELSPPGEVRQMPIRS